MVNDLPVKFLEIIARALWLILPAYIANASPVLVGWGVPIDGGKNFFDGERVLGDGKTFQGFLIGLSLGSLTGIFQIRLWADPRVQNILQTQVWNWKVPVLLALGALLGDMVASFIKRRYGVQRGTPILGVDQLDFVLGAFFLVSILWIPEWFTVVTWLVITPWIHLGTNMAAYKMNFKSKPY